MQLADRRLSRQIRVGSLPIGGNAPVSVQSMTNTDTRDVDATVEQICGLAQAGCELARLAVVDEEAAAAVQQIKKQVHIPVVADIHFDFRLAIKVMQGGVDGLRLNPGNIGGRDRVARVVEVAREYQVPIRIGVNAGSLEPALIAKYGGVTAEAMVESAWQHIRILEDMDFTMIKVSLKASDVPLMVQAYRSLAEKVDYPFHLGVTEAGTVLGGSVKSAVGLGILLAEGIGDTIRVSLTGDPRHEVRVGYQILQALKLRERGVELISCPTCGRCRINLVDIAEEVEQKLQHVTVPVRVAVMGCVVNGPGEARHADVGIAGGDGFAVLFRKGDVVRRVAGDEVVPALLAEIRTLTGEETIVEASSSE